MMGFRRFWQSILGGASVWASPLMSPSGVSLKNILSIIFYYIKGLHPLHPSRPGWVYAGGCRFFTAISDERVSHDRQG